MDDPEKVEFRMKVLTNHFTAFNRQVTEAVKINRNAGIFLMNSKSEYSRSLLPSVKTSDKKSSWELSELGDEQVIEGIKALKRDNVKFECNLKLMQNETSNLTTIVEEHEENALVDEKDESEVTVVTEEDTERRLYRADMQKREFISNYTFKTKKEVVWQGENEKNNSKLIGFKEKIEQYDVDSEDKLKIIGRLMRHIPERKPRKELCENDNECLVNPLLCENEILSNDKVSSNVVIVLGENENEGQGDSRLGENATDGRFNVQDTSYVENEKLNLKNKSHNERPSQSHMKFSENEYKVERSGIVTKNSSIDGSDSDIGMNTLTQVKLDKIIPKLDVRPHLQPQSRTRPEFLPKLDIKKFHKLKNISRFEPDPPESPNSNTIMHKSEDDIEHYYETSDQVFRRTKKEKIGLNQKEQPIVYENRTLNRTFEIKLGTKLGIKEADLVRDKEEKETRENIKINHEISNQLKNFENFKMDGTYVDTIDANEATDDDTDDEEKEKEEKENYRKREAESERNEEAIINTREKEDTDTEDHKEEKKLGTVDEEVKEKEYRKKDNEEKEKEKKRDTERKKPQDESVSTVKVAGKNVMDILMKFKERKQLKDTERKKESRIVQRKRGRNGKTSGGMLKGEQAIDKFMLKERKSSKTPDSKRKRREEEESEDNKDEDNIIDEDKRRKKKRTDKEERKQNLEILDDTLDQINPIDRNRKRRVNTLKEGLVREKEDKEESKIKDSRMGDDILAFRNEIMIGSPENERQKRILHQKIFSSPSLKNISVSEKIIGFETGNKILTTEKENLTRDRWGTDVIYDADFVRTNDGK